MTASTLASRALQSQIQLLRPRQWAKNALVFAAPLGAGVLLEPAALLPALAAFVAFSAAASSMYVLNDVLDAERDRAHPTKRRRPIAAGAVSIYSATVLAVGMGVTSLAIAALVSVGLMVVIGIYLGLTVAYSLRLKHVPVVDIVVVATGFVLRAIAGGVAADVPISSWFLIVASFGALFVVAGKRYAELTTLTGNGSDHRPSLDGYSPEYLRHVLTLSAGLAAIAYCLWAFEVPRAGTSQLLMQLSIVPFVTALLRYAHIVMQGRGGEPEEVFLRDRELLVLGVLWLVLFGVGVTLG
jgi:decaprenyl-phosphate phosphoribosyltransferase